VVGRRELALYLAPVDHWRRRRAIRRAACAARVGWLRWNIGAAVCNAKRSCINGMAGERTHGFGDRGEESERAIWSARLAAALERGSNFRIPNPVAACHLRLRPHRLSIASNTHSTSAYLPLGITVRGSRLDTPDPWLAPEQRRKQRARRQDFLDRKRAAVPQEVRGGGHTRRTAGIPCQAQ
jgi:hypothetical protein